MPKPWYSIQAASASADTTDIDILDAISSDWGVGARAFLKDFSAIKTPNVRVRINSPGGSVFEALAMFNGMRASGKHITTQVLGVAASAGSYIAMSGDRIVMPKNTMMFVHNPVMGLYGNAEDMREAADLLDKMGAQLLGAYEKRFTGTTDELQALFAAESYLTADECLAYGLCDEVTDEIAIEAKFDVDHLPANVQALLKHRPDAVVQPPPAGPAAVVEAVAAPGPADIQKIAAEFGVSEHAARLVLDETITTIDAARASAQRIRDVATLCSVAGASDRLNDFLSSRASYDDARKAINAKRVSETEATHVSSVTGSPVAVHVTLLSHAELWAQITKRGKA